MLTVIKRSGAKQEFSENKIKNSIALASDDARQPMNESDLEHITENLQQILQGKESVTAQQLVVIVCGLLYVSGFSDVMKQYFLYKGSL